MLCPLAWLLLCRFGLLNGAVFAEVNVARATVWLPTVKPSSAGLAVASTP
jgi:hypothetical protein